MLFSINNPARVAEWVGSWKETSFMMITFVYINVYKNVYKRNKSLLFTQNALFRERPP
jgi:hypothetical protein